MEAHQVRRLPVVNDKGDCCGIVSQADLARSAPLKRLGEVVREVSKPDDSLHPAS
jgi:CBS-domain-containing membrane protein